MAKLYMSMVLMVQLMVKVKKVDGMLEMKTLNYLLTWFVQSMWCVLFTRSIEFIHFRCSSKFVFIIYCDGLLWQ
jgi:hypothetical protein